MASLARLGSIDALISPGNLMKNPLIKSLPLVAVLLAITPAALVAKVTGSN